MKSLPAIVTLLLTVVYGAKYLRSSGNTSITTLSSSDLNLINILAAKYNCHEYAGEEPVLATVMNIIRFNSHQNVNLVKECQTFEEEDLGDVSERPGLHKDYCDETKSNLAEEKKAMTKIKRVLMISQVEHGDAASL